MGTGNLAEAKGGPEKRRSDVETSVLIDRSEYTAQRRSPKYRSSRPVSRLA